MPSTQWEDQSLLVVTDTVVRDVKRASERAETSEDAERLPSPAFTPHLLGPALWWDFVEVKSSASLLKEKVYTPIEARNMPQRKWLHCAVRNPRRGIL